MGVALARAGAGEGGHRPGEGRAAVPLARRIGDGSGVRAAKIEEGLELHCAFAPLRLCV